MAGFAPKKPGVPPTNFFLSANKFINSLDTAQKAKALYPFDVEERYNFHYFPIEDRKGISMNELSASQKEVAMELIKTCLSAESVQKAKEIMGLEMVLKALEHRKPEDHYRDPGKYNITIFGIPAANTTWGWRFEGHHISYNFSADKKKLRQMARSNRFIYQAFSLTKYTEQIVMQTISV